MLMETSTDIKLVWLLNILYAPRTSIVGNMRQELKERFKMKDLGVLHYILGWEIQRDRKLRILKVSQQRYTQKMLEKYNMAECNGSYIPCRVDTKLTKSMSPSSEEERSMMSGKPYREIVGSLMYLMLGTRPDLAFAIRECSTFLSDPGIEHWKAVKVILRYVSKTRSYGLHIGHADFANHEDRKSIAGYVTMFGSSIISWCSKAERTVALHTTEAEYIAISMLVQEVIHFRAMLKELKLAEPEATIVFTDNMSALKISKNSEFHQRSKHIDVTHHFIRERQANKEIAVERFLLKKT